ncbi:uncharacterized protein LOC144449742 isoform X2 [Glandiceps talaboti]
MNRAKDSTRQSSTKQLHATILFSKKFLESVKKDKDVKRAIEELLLEDKKGTLFALIWIDVSQTDVEAFSAKLANQWKDLKTFPGVQAVNYREYKDDYAALAEAVYKIWNGAGTYVEKPNQPMSSREAQMSEPKREPVESMDPTVAMAMDADSTRPTIGTEANEGLFMLQDKMSSSDDKNMTVNNVLDKEQKKEGGKVTQHDTNNEVGQLAIDVSDGKNLFDKEDCRSSEKHENADCNLKGASAVETGNGNSEKVIDVNNAPDFINGVEPDCNEKDSLAHQSEGCMSIQSAGQDSIDLVPNALQEDSTLPVQDVDRENDDSSKKEENENSRSENEEPEEPGLMVNANGDGKNIQVKKSVEEQHPPEVKENITCDDPECHSKNKVIPESQFFSSTSSSSKLVKNFNEDVKEELMCLLDPPFACVKDWRHLASRKGVPNKKITYWEKQKESGTICYLEYLASKHPKYTTEEFKKDIRGISRMDVLDMLEELKI